MPNLKLVGWTSIVFMTCVAMPAPTQAVSAGTCLGPHGEPGMTFDVEITASDCIFVCQSNSLVSIGVTGNLSSGPIGGCHTIDLCPESSPFVVQVDGHPCVKPILSPCPPPYAPLPTSTSGIPGVDPLTLCIRVSAQGCPGGEPGIQAVVTVGQTSKPISTCNG